MSVPKIAVFDSGVGGLSILDHLQRSFPHASFLYWSDPECFPYGIKTEQAIVQRVSTLLPNLCRHHQPDILVVACNTVSTHALDRLRTLISIPIVGTVPAIKPAAERSKSKVLGLLATEATIRSSYTEKLISEFASDCVWVKVGSAKLVTCAEKKLKNEPIEMDIIHTELEPFFTNPKLDTVVLACTHFPHLKQEFTRISPRDIFWIDSGEAIARRVRSFFSPGL
ncbi:MAG: glutamate racemase [Deltaproteobacteria bacterium]|nr:glutamate racemase [Deltaproteobacteria bacterium]